MIGLGSNLMLIIIEPSDLVEVVIFDKSDGLMLSKFVIKFS